MDQPASTLAQIAGNSLLVYESLYSQIDPTNTNHIPGLEAANFLKKSGLSQMTLGKIWDLSDPNGNGFLDKKGMFVALKMISLVQNGRQPLISDLLVPMPPPKMGEEIDWTIKSNERTKYEEMFLSLNPVDNKLSGNRVKPIMVNSKLPVEMLTKIWDLSDIDQDGCLDRDEFVLCMHLITKALEKVPLPAALPKELLNIKQKKSIDLAWSAFDGPVSATSPVTDNQTSETNLKNAFNKSSGLNTWIVNASDKTKSDEIFQRLDRDLDGFVTGIDVKDTLIQTGLPQNALAHIWNLCDVKENGKLNSEQFALAMYFVKTKQQGMELPSSLLPEMVPPTLRPKPLGLDNHALELTNTQPLQTNGNSSILGIPVGSSGNKELDSLAEELKELQMEKNKLETEVIQDEANIKLKQSEIKNIQNEIETLNMMLKQLDTQKVEAKKRLDDLSDQSVLLEKELHELKQNIMEENLKIDSFNQQLEEQKTKIESQEKEISSKKQELDQLKLEETKLEMRLDAHKREVDYAAKNIGNTQLEISQIKTKLIEFEEYERRLNDGIADLDSSLESNDIAKLNNLLPRTITPPLIENTAQNNATNDFDSSNFEAEFPSGDFSVDPFANEDPFKETDVFKNENFSNDPFSENEFKSQNEAFDPFGTGSFTTKDQRDPFAADPFVPKAPERSESPTPALPPKKSKAPPPRPAPPKHANKSAPLRAAPAPPSQIDDPFKSDPFSSSQTAFDPFNSGDNRDAFASNSFANFANFDKVEMPPPVDPYASLASIHLQTQQMFDAKSQNFAKPINEAFHLSLPTSHSFLEAKPQTFNQDKVDFEYAFNSKINDKFIWK